MNMESIRLIKIQQGLSRATEANLGAAKTFVHTHRHTAGSFNARIIEGFKKSQEWKSVGNNVPERGGIV